MFDKQYRFKGKHAFRVDRLTSVFDEQSKAKLFNRNIDVYTSAPLVGFLYGRMADVDNMKNPDTNEVYSGSVFSDRVVASQDELMFNFQLIMLLDKHYEIDEEKRIDKAFRHIGQDPDDEQRFDCYVRGGVDVLYEKLIENVNDPEEYVNRLFDFVEDFQSKFNMGILSDDIIKLCTNK
jgi:hypothetical protein